MALLRVRGQVLRVPTLGVATYHAYILETHDGPLEIRLNVQYDDPGIWSKMSKLIRRFWAQEK